ncbi:MAG: thioredoxin domain-containing protein [Bacillota bacterium]|nr:thioredoxin domain-containing protein [Bacillota bacterium]
MPESREPRDHREPREPHQPHQAGPPHGPHERTANRLAHEKSPYLLQHAYNPVDWYPWGNEAFDRARAENKPVFLSIGYSTCHWCHVMERESFEDPEVAGLMNQAFISIKVDREERPDIDQAYMPACEMMTGHGGWPLTIIMTPEKEPFYAATYLPKQARFGQIGMLELVPRVKELWEAHRDEITSSAADIVSLLQRDKVERPGPGEDRAIPDTSLLDQAYRQLSSWYDRRNGGFGAAPKFPVPTRLSFLLRYWRRTGQSDALAMVEHTLEAMRRGGMFDQIGFGFHRYSTDARWLLPHFEKMLYDQALLLSAYVEAYQATDNEVWRDTAREICTYVLRDLTLPEGGFCSSEDADSEGEEGKFYVWTEDEIRHVLDGSDADGTDADGRDRPDGPKMVGADEFIRIHGVQAEGNFAEEATRRRTGSNVLHMPSAGAFANGSAGEDDLSGQTARTAVARRRLFAAREGRVRPFRDDKVLADWNGLMIAALAKASAAFDEPAYAVAAARAADFVLSALTDDKGRLLHRYRDGHAAIAGYLDDYAFFISGLLELHQATFEVRHLASALRLQRDLVDRFLDETAGGFFFTARDAEEVLSRQKTWEDGAVPAGNSVALGNLVRLSRLTGDTSLEELAAHAACTASAAAAAAPASHTALLSALDFAIGPSYEVVVTGDRKSADTREMLRALLAPYIPNVVVMLRPQDEAHEEREAENASALAQIAPFTAELTTQGGRTTAYVCHERRCELPTTDVGSMLGFLGMTPDGHFMLGASAIADNGMTKPGRQAPEPPRH